jgi:transposase
VNPDTSLQFLRELAASDPASHHAMIRDGAGFHQRNGDKSVKANISLIRLPAYSPELNPIKKPWDVVKYRICNVRRKKPRCAGIRDHRRASRVLDDTVAREKPRGPRLADPSGKLFESRISCHMIREMVCPPRGDVGSAVE